MDFHCVRWKKPGHSPSFGYDFWYQPRHKTMISSSWGAPLAFSKGFNPQHVSEGLYGRHLFVYSWPDGELKQTLDLGNTGLIPLEVSQHKNLFLNLLMDRRVECFLPDFFIFNMQIRFLHDPAKDTGFVGCALSSNMVRFFKNPDGSWSHEVRPCLHVFCITL